METGSRELLAYSIGEFCDKHRISRSFFYKLASMGQSPVQMRVGAERGIARRRGMLPGGALPMITGCCSKTIDPFHEIIVSTVALC
jgi:hypothetical protein